MKAANVFVETCHTVYNRRFGKIPRHDFDVHRPVEYDENLDLIFTIHHSPFTIRETRKVSKALTKQCDKMLYLIEEIEYSHLAIG